MPAVDSHSQAVCNQYIYRGTWPQLLRLPTLSGTISPILVGTGIAALTGHIRLDLFIGMLIASIFVQTATNIFNDYFDFLGGQDKNKWIKYGDSVNKQTPRHKTLPIIAGMLLAAAALIGIWLAIESTLWMLAAGAVAITFGYLYSGVPRPLSSIGLGEVVAAVFLGFMVTILSYMIQGHKLDILIILVAGIFALLISTMILTNNIRDIKKDKQFRHTTATILGKKQSVRLLAIILALVYGWTISLIIIGLLPWYGLICILALPLAWRLIRSFRDNASSQEEMLSMKRAALHHWTFGLLLALGVWLAV